MLLKKLMYIYARTSDHVFELFLPRTCVLCGDISPRRNICPGCQQDLPILPYHCQQCAKFLPLHNLQKCGDCLQNAPTYSRILALFPYEMPIIQMITRLKFNKQLCFAKTFAELFQMKIQQIWYENSKLPDLIMPMPLHRDRLRERGFNQTIEIARPIAKLLNIPLDLSGITRIKSTAPQSGLTANERQLNIKNAFCLSRDYSGLHIAVLDDVVTTGSTVNELCQALNYNGATHIDVWCCARRG